MRQLPVLFATIAALTVASPAWACGGGGGGGDKHGQGEDCCAPNDKGGHAACCEADEKGGHADCCGSEDHHGKGGHHDKGEHRGHQEHRGHHGDMDMDDRPDMDGRMHGMRGHRMRGPKMMELRYMPATTGNQHLVLAWDRRRALNDWFSMGFMGNYALQLAPAAGQGHWFTPYGGIVPRIGTNVGNVRLDVGALLGFGAMMRTTTIAGAGSDFLQLRPMWVVEPRVELGFDQGPWRMGLVGTYALSPNPADFSGPSVGVRFGFGGPRRME